MPYFEYSTVKDVREEGVSVDDASDDRVRSVIRMSSSLINAFTSSIFSPIVGVKHVDGKASSHLHLPNFLPIAKLSAIEVIDARRVRRQPESIMPNRGVWFPIDVKDVGISANRRFIEFVVDPASGTTSQVFGNPMFDGAEIWFPRGVQNIKLTGVFGWLEEYKDVSSIVAIAAAVRTGKIVIDDASEWEEGDWCIFPDGSLQVVTGVVKATNSLLFQADSLKLQTAVALDDVLLTYGRTPILIRQACTRLVIANHNKLGGSSSSSVDPTADAIIEERTDNYFYRKDPNLISQMIQAGSSGDAWVDAILQQFIDEMPLYVGMV